MLLKMSIHKSFTSKYNFELGEGCMPKRLLRWARILDKYYTLLSEKEYLFDMSTIYQLN